MIERLHLNAKKAGVCDIITQAAAKAGQLYALLTECAEKAGSLARGGVDTGGNTPAMPKV